MIMMHAGRSPGRYVLALAAAGLMFGLAGDADALKVCGKRTKKGLKGLELVEGDCPKKREAVIDFTGEFTGLTGRMGEVGGRLDGLGGRLDGLGGRLDGVDARVNGLGGRLDAVQLVTLGAECDGQPTRTLAPSGDLLDVQSRAEQSTEGCRAYDNDQTACDAAFELADTGPASCFYLNGKCRACDFAEHATGACLNTCDTDAPQACKSGARSRFAGSYCSEVLDQATCEVAWVDGGRGAIACKWQEFQVLPGDPPRGQCVNTNGLENVCGEVPAPPDCRPQRQIVQDPQTLAFGSCYSRTLEADCNASAQRDVGDDDEDGSTDDAVSCYFLKRPNVTGGTCTPCAYEEELRGRCTNVCP